MAFQTNTLINGEWTTQTLNVEAVLKHYNQKDQQEAIEVETAPELGLLSQTVIRTPLAHWILPGVFRESSKNDVAFIGDSFVQIKQLRQDGHLWDVVYKDNFGARIRNARVAGLVPAKLRKEDYREMSVKLEVNGDVQMRDDSPGVSSQGPFISPQFIILQLETHDTVFLSLHKSHDGVWKFRSSRHRVSKTMHNLQPGMHLAVEPSSRYMAVGSSEGYFAIFSLRTRPATESRQPRSYEQGQAKFDYVNQEHYFYIHGVILKMEFLHPPSDDPRQIILLIFVVRKGRTRMMVYEWMVDDDLEKVRPQTQKGHLLEESRQIPLLVIPLTLNSSFVLVSESSLAVCQNILEGSPQFIELSELPEEPTEFHHGVGVPLWTAWTRPPRLDSYKAQNDVIYIVREDGFVRCLEISKEEALQADTTVGHFHANCGSALASLDFYGYLSSWSGDFLITGGDAGVGAAYLIEARQFPVFQQHIPNWSPVHDFVTTSKCQDHENQSKSNNTFTIQDKMYACAGRNTDGSIVELRHGFEAHIGIDFEYDTQILNLWTLAPEMSVDDNEHGTMILLSLPHKSALLQLSRDFSEVRDIDSDQTRLDLRYRTIATGIHGTLRIQVTEQSVVFDDWPQLCTREDRELLGVYNEDNLVGYGREVMNAVVYRNTVIYSTNVELATYLLLLYSDGNDVMDREELPHPSSTIAVRNLGRIPNPTTALAACMLDERPCALVASWSDSEVKLTLHPLDGSLCQQVHIPEYSEAKTFQLEELVSMEVSSGKHGILTLVAGTRNGIMVILQIDEKTVAVVGHSYDRVGVTPVTIKQDSCTGSNLQFFAICDSRLHTVVIPLAPQFSKYASIDTLIYHRIEQVYLTNTQERSFQSPSVSSVSKLIQNEFVKIDGNAVVVASGRQLLVAGLSTQPKPLPRQLYVGGTPSRLLYSESLGSGLLLVAASVDGKSVLYYIDPETGLNVSRPTDKKGNTIAYAGGLGQTNDRIFRLLEWSYTKDRKTWNFVVLSTHSGRVLIISSEKETREDGSFDVRFWTRYKFKCEKPVYAIVGYTEGLFYCSGTTLFCDTLDLVEKKFQHVAVYELPSPAINLIYQDGKVYVLTSAHSVEILRLITETSGPCYFERTHGDNASRSSLHHRFTGRSTNYPLHLVSDKECSISGLWATQNNRVDTLETVFEAELPYSILRLRHGLCRPIWDPTRLSAGSSLGLTTSPTEVNTAQYPEIFGISNNGSLCHFTILDKLAWKFLRLIINLALQSPRICEFTYHEKVTDISQLEPVTEPKSMMHIDGDILRRCLEDGALEELLLVEEKTEDAAWVHKTFWQLYNSMHRAPQREAPSAQDLVQRVYRDLEYFLRPVM